MPVNRLPVANDIGKAQPTAGPLVQSTADNFGAQVGRAVEGLGGATFDLSIQVRDTAEKAEANEINAKMARYSRLLEVGGTDDDGNEVVGYRSLEGKEAVDKAEEYERMLAEKRDTLLDSASSSRVRTLSEKAVTSHFESGMGSIGAGRLQGAKAYKEAASKTLTTELEQRAIANSTTFDQQGADNKVASSVAAIGQEVYNREKERLGGEAAASVAQEAMSEARIKVLEDLNQRDPAMAEAYLQSLLKREREEEGLSKGDLLNPEAVTKFRETLEVSTRLQLAQATVDEMSVRFNGLKTADDITKARAEIRKKYSGKEEKAINDQLNQVVAEQERLERMARNDAEAAISSFVYTNQGSVSDFFRQNPDQARLVSGNGTLLSALEQAPAKMAQRGEAATFAPARTREGTANYERLTSAENRDALVAENPDMYRHAMTQKQYDDLKKKRNTELERRELIKKGEGPIFEKADKIAQDVAASFAPKQFSNTKTGLKKAENSALLRDMQSDLDRYIVDQVKAGHVPGAQELNGEAARLMIRFSADPENTGPLLSAQPGEEDVRGFMFEIENLSPKQLEVLQVDEKTRTEMPELDRRLDAYLKQYEGFSDADLAALSQDQRSDLAGAFYSLNDARMEMLVQLSRPTGN